jgi:hypothetical protein
MAEMAAQNRASKGTPRAHPASASGAAGIAASAKKLLTAFASLRLTVALFALSIVLVFSGTLAQVDEGIWTVLGKYFRSLVVWIPVQIYFKRSVAVPGSFPFPGGWLLGGLLLTNLLAAHFTRFRANWRRAGILIIHGGLVLMMLSEFVTGVFAVEGNMAIDQGSASNYVVNQRATELALVDASDPKMDDMVVVPDRMLKRGGRVHHDFLPVDLDVVRYMINSDVVPPARAPADAKNRATAGAGLSAVAVERPEVSGADPNQTVDTPSAYVTLKSKGSDRTFGTYLVSVLVAPQPVTVDGRAYELSLRFRRTYKPYTFHLLEFRHDRYLGTDKPKNFSSLVRLVDPSVNEDREVKIWMNHPLRHAGETFYQSSFKPGDTGTILQVVRNPGWLMPYISCVMVSGGMLFHFGMHLYDFLRRRVLR